MWVYMDILRKFLYIKREEIHEAQYVKRFTLYERKTGYYYKDYLLLETGIRKEDNKEKIVYQKIVIPYGLSYTALSCILKHLNTIIERLKYLRDYKRYLIDDELITRLELLRNIYYTSERDIHKTIENLYRISKTLLT